MRLRGMLPSFMRFKVEFNPGYWLKNNIYNDWVPCKESMNLNKAFIVEKVNKFPGLFEKGE